MSDKSFDDFLVQQLQRNSNYIEDDRFTSRVMASLPADRRLNPWLERLIVIVPVTLIALMVASQLPWRDFIRSAYGWVLTFDSASLISLVVGIILVAVVCPVLWTLKRSSLI